MAILPRYNEDTLCRILSEKIRGSEEFCEWILSQTKFAGRSARLLYEEQVSARPKVKSENWWRHWWRKIPDLSQERETDIFLVFEDRMNSERFALHIENKQDAKFSPGQAEDYGPRARWMMKTPRYLNYSDFQTVLVSPKRLKDNDPRASLFHCFISYEEICRHIPEFTVQVGVA